MHKYLSRLLSNQQLEASELEEICSKAMEILIREPNLPCITTPVVVCGDIHGQFLDLLNLLKMTGMPPSSKYIFLGDYVDRGPQSVECVTLVLLFKILYPDHIVVVRGNHEQKEICRTYGFYDEIMKKYNSSSVWRMFCEVFDCFNVGCLIEGRIFCVHGGLSKSATSLNQIKRIDRFQEIKKDEIFTDLTWGDPQDEDGFRPSPRGAGYLYGRDVTRRFLEMNGLTQIIRSHQLVLEGYKFHHPEKSVVTVWSAPNYMGKCDNPASLLLVRDSYEVTEKDLRIFHATPLNMKRGEGKEEEEKISGLMD